MTPPVEDGPSVVRDSTRPGEPDPHHSKRNGLQQGSPGVFHSLWISQSGDAHSASPAGLHRKRPAGRSVRRRRGRDGAARNFPFSPGSGSYDGQANRRCTALCALVRRSDNRLPHTRLDYASA